MGERVTEVLANAKGSVRKAIALWEKPEQHRIPIVQIRMEISIAVEVEDVDGAR